MLTATLCVLLLPTVPALHSDRDADGVADGFDACPDFPAGKPIGAPTDGCPAPHPADSDGDGVPDSIDGCPSRPEDIDGVLDADGCPDLDNDGDGVQDSADRCPQAAGSLQAHGCGVPPNAPTADKDGDKVPDARDACPELFGRGANGCPPVVLVERSHAELKTLKPLNFAAGTNRIRENDHSYAIIAQVAELLKLHPELRVQIEGYTDGLGPKKRNRILSRSRAERVRRELIEHGIEAPRLLAHGFGATHFVDTNKTPFGRAHNRRVVFKIISDQALAEDTPAP